MFPVRMKIEGLAGALASQGGTLSGAALPRREVVPGPCDGGRERFTAPLPE